MTYLVLDLETGSKEAYKRRGNPWINKIVSIGYANNNKAISEYYTDPGFDTIPHYLHETTVIVGHNIKYDLLYLWKIEKFQDWLKQGGKIWDTQLVEYILTAHQEKFVALRDVCVRKYGCKEREKKMEAYWEQGIDTFDIPKELVIEDVTQDVLDTEQIYLQQIIKAEELGMTPLIKLQMDALLSTTEMESNGIPVNKDTLSTNKALLIAERDICDTSLLEMIKPYWKNVKEPLNLASPAQLSLLFFGGKLTQIRKEPVLDIDGNFVTIKSGINKGSVKLKKQPYDIEIEGLGVSPKEEWFSVKGHQYSTKEEVMQYLVDELPINTDAYKIAKQLLTSRQLTKQITTYYEAVLETMYPDGMVRSKFSHAATATGRTTSSGPNVQNIPKSSESAVKKHFVSRFRGGMILEADYSQLEVVVQAQLSGDTKYINDVINKVDFHVKRLALKERMPYETVLYNVKTLKLDDWIERRSKVKAFSFAKNYGAGTKKLAKQTGLTEEEIKELIKAENKEYSRLKLYNDWCFEQVTKSDYKGIGFYSGPTGRRWSFMKRESPQWKKDQGEPMSFMPTEVVNYKTQGTGSDIVLSMLGKFWREIAIHNRDKFLIINTVHDSIIFDVKAEYVDFLKNLLYTKLTKVKELMEENFNYKWVVPVEIEIKTGKTWWDC